jgi:hypothetical protein
LFSERDAGGFGVAAAIIRNQIFGDGASEVGPNPTRTLLANPYSNPAKESRFSGPGGIYSERRFEGGPDDVDYHVLCGVL